jgi:hypothetical protein
MVLPGNESVLLREAMARRSWRVPGEEGRMGEWRAGGVVYGRGRRGGGGGIAPAWENLEG